ncbi:MAG: HPr(Ser) kinase/phosphatase [Butyricicoccaceae bacterium]
MAAKYSIMVHELIKEFRLEVICGPEGYLERKISDASVNRPGLQLTGFYEGFDSDRIQVLGGVEHNYLSQFSEAEQEAKFDALFAHDIPVLILSSESEALPICSKSAMKFGVPVLKAQEHASDLIAELSRSLNVHLGARTTMHGVLMEVYGEGILLIGDSGVGKSETAVELIKRGHRLVADDAVDIKRVSAKSLVGSAPELIRYFMELRGIGIVDVRRLFGMGAVKPTEKIDLIINLENWVDGKAYDRMGTEENYTTILDIAVPSLTVPVKPGRNLAVVIEVAAMNNRHKKMGHNAGKELEEKLYNSMLAELGEQK